MDDFLDDKPKQTLWSRPLWRAYRRLFVLVLAVAVLWQVISLLQMQLSHMHTQLSESFTVVLAAPGSGEMQELQTMGKELSEWEDIVSVKLFSAPDALAALQKQNPRLTEGLVGLGTDLMPAYFELQLSDAALANAAAFADNLSARYPTFSVHYNERQARLAFYSGLLLRTVNIATAAAALLFIVFMFLVEAHPVQGVTHTGMGVVSAVGAGLLSLGLMALLAYPTGLLLPALAHFTTPERQAALMVFCGLWGWSLTKWQKF